MPENFYYKARPLQNRALDAEIETVTESPVWAVQDVLQQALAHHRAGRLEKAEAIYRQILATDSRHADSLHLLGMVEHQRGRHEIAVEMIRQAIAINPNEAAYHSNLGTIYQTQGKLDEAAECFERALTLKPGWAEIQSNLGNVLQTQGKLEEAAACQERALAFKPDCAEAHSNLGNIRQGQGKLEQALTCYERALALKPDYADAHNNLGNLFAKQDKIDEAVAHYERALVLKPDWAYAHNNLASVLTLDSKTTEALAHFERALALYPNYANAHNNLGNLFKELGRFDDAMAHYDRAIAIKPDYAEAHLNRAEVKTFERGDADLAGLEALAASGDLSADKAPYVLFAVAKALDDIGDYYRAFRYLRQGNALKRRQIDYDERGVLKVFQRISRIFNRDLLDRFQGAGHPSAVPIFVVGMPRSGSTLIEQILATHPQIQGAGEITVLERMEAEGAFNRQLPYPESIPAFDAGDFRGLGESYLSRQPALGPGQVRIVDKLLGNIFRIGLIRLMLPNARFIHATRHPMDTCMSCYSKLFTFGLHFSYDLAELGRYYRGYIDLMDHWRSVLPPGVMLDVAYEDVVDDLEGQARRLIDFCGLPWDDGCVRFHESTRLVKTASAVQVRQPLFRSSLGRWRRYEAHLGPLLDELRS
jgi:tetratricopeptide (TPR) repeat protein